MRKVNVCMSKQIRKCDTCGGGPTERDLKSGWRELGFNGKRQCSNCLLGTELNVKLSVEDFQRAPTNMEIGQIWGYGKRIRRKKATADFN